MTFDKCYFFCRFSLSFCSSQLVSYVTLSHVTGPGRADRHRRMFRWGQPQTGWEILKGRIQRHRTSVWSLRSSMVRTGCIVVTHRWARFLRTSWAVRRTDDKLVNSPLTPVTCLCEPVWHHSFESISAIEIFYFPLSPFAAQSEMIVTINYPELIIA